MIKTLKKPNFSKYKRRLENADKVILSMGEPLIVGIVKRTQTGMDVTKKSFKPYSKAYKKKGTVNLTDKGTMLHAITYTRIKNGIKLSFNTRSEKIKSYVNQVKYSRKFFGLDKGQIDLIRKKIIKSILGKK